MNTPFRPKSSLCCLSLFIILYGGALICVLTLSLVMWVKGLLALFILAHGVFSLCYRRGVTSFYYDNGQWRLFDRAAGKIRLLLQPSSVVTRYVMLLNFRCQKTTLRRTILLFPDSLPSDQLRYLRSQLLGGSYQTEVS